MTPDSLAGELLLLTYAERVAAIDKLSARERESLRPFWRVWAHPEQIPPEGAWHTWLIMAGRGYGKTRAGAEWVREVAENDPTARIEGPAVRPARGTTCCWGCGSACSRARWRRPRRARCRC
jgi:phage terminase large subunit-like protein